MSEKKTVAIVEDDFLIAEYLRMTCVELGAEVVGMASKPDEAIEMIERLTPAYVLMDVRLGGKRDGVDVAIKSHRSYPDMKIIFITGSNEPPTIDRINSDDPHEILIKPINQGDLAKALGL